MSNPPQSTTRYVFYASICQDVHRLLGQLLAGFNFDQRYECTGIKPIAAIATCPIVRTPSTTVTPLVKSQSDSGRVHWMRCFAIDRRHRGLPVQAPTSRETFRDRDHYSLCHSYRGTSGHVTDYSSSRYQTSPSCSIGTKHIHRLPSACVVIIFARGWCLSRRTDSRPLPEPRIGTV